MVRRLIAAAQETCEVDSDGYTDLGRDEDVEQAKETWMTWPRWKREGFCDRNHLVLIARHESGDSATSSEDNDEEEDDSPLSRARWAFAHTKLEPVWEWNDDEAWDPWSGVPFAGAADLAAELRIAAETDLPGSEPDAVQVGDDVVDDTAAAQADIDNAMAAAIGGHERDDWALSGLGDDMDFGVASGGDSSDDGDGDA
jgi:hypothetical protein